MTLSANLWDSQVPPGIWITLGTLAQPQDDYVTVTLRIKEEGKRSVSATGLISRYAPSDSVIMACSKCVTSLAVTQAAIDKPGLDSCLQAAIRNWVDPF